MRILIISRGPLGYLTDAVKLSQFALAADHRLTFLSFDSLRFMLPDRSWRTLSGLETRTVSSVGPMPIRFSRWLRSCLREARRAYDVVYVYYFPGSSLLSLFGSRRSMVLDVRSGCTDPGRLGRLLHNLLISAEARFFFHLTVISEGLARKLRLPASKCRILPLGADPVDVPPKNFDDLHLLYVGNLSARRRIEDTIVGFAAFRERASVRLRYTIVGDGAPGRLESLRNLVRRFRLDDCIELTGFVPHHQLPVYFERANVGVSYVPITDYYNHQPPTKTFEYLFAGMPVVATSTTENMKIINSSNGVLIEDSAEAFSQGLSAVSAARSSYNSVAIRASAGNCCWEHIMTKNALPYLEWVAGRASQ